MAYAFCVASLEAKPPRPGQNGGPKYAAVENLPTPGEKFTFEPENGQALAPGVYVLIGSFSGGTFTDQQTGRPVTWRKLKGQAVSVSLADGEKALGQMLARVSK